MFTSRIGAKRHHLSSAERSEASYPASAALSAAIPHPSSAERSEASYLTSLRFAQPSRILNFSLPRQRFHIPGFIKKENDSTQPRT